METVMSHTAVWVDRTKSEEKVGISVSLTTDEAEIRRFSRCAPVRITVFITLILDPIQRGEHRGGVRPLWVCVCVCGGGEG